MIIMRARIEGHRRRCDGRCYNSKSLQCRCICGGKNHGVGQEQAIENTKLMADEYAERFKDNKLQFAEAVAQREMSL